MPQRLGSYVIHDRIGDGGMAEIFLAKMVGYSGFEKLVALKRILPRYSQNPAFARMLIEEAKLAARIQHLNVVQVHDLGEIDGQVFIAMEYVKGRDLAALLSNAYRRQERMPVELSLFIALEFLTGLDFAHRLVHQDGSPLALIHRDISPQNVLISYEGEVKLTDFGIARVIESSGETRLPGNLHGKFGYMSPEQIEGLPLDQRSDVFGAGVVLHEMLTGQRLFRAKTPKATVELIRTMDIPRPSSLNPSVPVDIDAVTLKALCKERDDRYQTVGAFLGELSRAADALARRSSRRDLAVYMKRHFGTTTRDAKQVSSPPRQPLAGTSTNARTPLGLLASRHFGVPASAVDLALTEQRARGGRIGELLVESGALDESSLAKLLAMQAGLESPAPEDVNAYEAPAELVSRFPRTVAEGTLVVPLMIEEQRAVLATADPYAQRQLLEAKIILGVGETTVVVVSRSEVHRLIARWYGPEELVTDSPDILVEQPVEYIAPVELLPFVLIADADARGAQLLADRLRLEDLDVEVLHDGRRARALCREKNPMVVVLDAHLPAVDGFNVLLDIRGRSADSAVFITSARPDAFTESKALELGADDFLAKPIHLEVMTSKVRREVQKRTSARRAQPTPTSFNGVSGSLLEMSLIDIIQGLELARKTALVVFQYDDGRKGEVRVRAGRIVAATLEDLQGDSAFYGLARPGDGVFRIEYRSTQGADNIHVSTTALILEALRRIDEQDREPPGVSPRDLVSDLEDGPLPQLSQLAPAPTTAPAPERFPDEARTEFGLVAPPRPVSEAPGRAASDTPGRGTRVARIELSRARVEPPAPRSRREELAELAERMAPSPPPRSTSGIMLIPAGTPTLPPGAPLVMGAPGPVLMGTPIGAQPSYPITQGLPSFPAPQSAPGVPPPTAPMTSGHPGAPAYPSNWPMPPGYGPPPRPSIAPEPYGPRGYPYPVYPPAPPTAPPPYSSVAPKAPAAWGSPAAPDDEPVDLTDSAELSPIP